MKFSMTGQEIGDILIEVTTWAGLTVIVYHFRDGPFNFQGGGYGFFLKKIF